MHGWLGLLALCVVSSVFSPSAFSMVEGKKAEPDQFPFVFGLKLEQTKIKDASGFSGSDSEELFSAYCGSVAIHPELLITSAHCLTSKSMQDTRILHVSENIRIDKDSAFGPIEIERAVFKPEYQNAKIIFNDLAYIKLSRPLNIPPEKLAIASPVDPSAEHVPLTQAPEGSVNVVGYGTTRYYRYYRQYGESAFRSAGIKHYGEPKLSQITADWIAYRSKTYRMNVGDSGGGIFLKEGSRYRVLGINSRIDDHDPLRNSCDAVKERKSRRACRKLHRKLAKQSLPDPNTDLSYAAPLTLENLCWIQESSGVRLGDLDCSAVP